MNQRGCPSPVCSALLIIGSGIDGFLAGGPWARKEEKPRRKAFRFGFRASHRAENRSTIKPLSGGFRLVRRADQSHLLTFLCRHREQNKRMQWHSIWKTDRRPSRFDIGRGWFYFHVQLKEDHCLVSSIPHSQKKKKRVQHAQKLRAKPLSIHDVLRITHVGHVGGSEDRERSQQGLSHKICTQDFLNTNNKSEQDYGNFVSA